MKSDEEIFKTLTDAAQHEFASDPRWEQLSRGTLPERDVQELRALAERFDAIALFDACRPSTTEERERLYKPIVDPATHTAPQQVKSHGPPLPSVPSEKRPPAPFQPRIRRLRRFVPYVAIGFAAAAAASLAYWLRPAEAPIASISIPEFVLDPLRGDAENRALAPADASVPHFGPDSHFNLVFRPKNAVEGVLETRSVLLQGDVVKSWHPGVSFQPNGLGRITGKVSELFYQIPAGQWQICLLVGRPEALPAQPADIAKKCRSPEPPPRAYWPLLQDIALQHTGSTSEPNQLIPGLTIETNGCRSVRTGPICAIPKSRKINLWVKTNNGTDLHVLIDDQAVTATRTPIQSGVLVPIELPKDVHEVFVKEMVGDKIVGSFRLQVEEVDEVRELEEAEARRSQNDYDGALSALASLSHDTRPLVRAQAKRMQARIERTKGNADQAIALFNESIPVDRDQGRVSDEIDDRLALVFTLLMNSTHRQDRFAEARRALEGIDALATQSPEGHSMIPYFRGLLALETGDFMGALEFLRAARDDAERVHREDLQRAIALSLANTLSTLGRFGEAREMLRDLERTLTPGTDPCAKAALLTNIGWQIRASQRASATGDGFGGTEESPIDPSQTALAIFRKDCKQPSAIANVLANLALMALDEGKPRDARRYLDEARQVTPRPTERDKSDWILAEAHLALTTKKPDAALNQFDKVAAIAQREGSSEHRIGAALGRARALEALGKLAEARKAYAHADILLEDKSLLIPMGEGRLSFLARYEEVARHRMSYLLRQANGDTLGRTKWLRIAVDTARSNRARVLAAIQWMDRINHLDKDHRAEWEKSIAGYRNERESLDAKLALAMDTFAGKDLDIALREYEAAQQQLVTKLSKVLGIVAPTTALPQPSQTLANLPIVVEGELLLVYHPTVDGWVGFAVTTDDVVAVPLAAVNTNTDPVELTRKLLAPFRATIDGASRIRFAAYGSLDQIRFHALPWNGRTLIHHAPVTYGLDLPAIASNKVPENDKPHAVIVADSLNDLPDASKEADKIAGLLDKLGWRVTKLVGDRATHQAVVEALAQSDTALLHVAGHAVVQGVDGWRSGIPLAKGGGLTLGDVVALPQVPRLVVLSACDGDKRGLEKDKSVLTLAQGFAVAGSAEVVAAVDTVNSERARSMMTLFYEALPHGSMPDAPALLRTAILKTGEDGKQTDWDTYRVLVP